MTIFKKITVIFIAVCMLCTLLSVSFPAFAAGESFITQLCISTSNTDSGYSFVSPGLNLRAENATYGENINVYLGYVKGSEGDAITGIKVSETYNASGISVDGIGYTPVSDISLNYGNDGKDIYLYYTKDKNAGEPIRSLELSAYRTDSEDVDYDGSAIVNNGAIPVLYDSGSVANLDEGRTGLYLYLSYIQKTVYKPYIKSVHVASADNTKDAITKLASLGCNYYFEYVLVSSGQITLMGYERTADKSEAVTSLRAITASDLGEGDGFNDLGKGFKVNEKVSVVDGEQIYLAESHDGDTPVYSVSFEIYEDGDKTDVAERALCIFGSVISLSQYLRYDSGYAEALKSTEELGFYYIPIVNGAHLALTMCYAGGESFTEKQQEFITEEETTDIEEQTKKSEKVMDSADEDYPIKENKPNPEMDPSQRVLEYETQAENSEISIPILVSVICIAVALAASVITVISVKQKKKK